MEPRDCFWVHAYLTQIIIFITLPRGSWQGAHEKRLIEDIFYVRKYNKYERPVANESDPLKVTFGLTLQQIIDVDEKNQILISNIWLNMDEKNQILESNVWLNLVWTDYNLSWNESEYGGLKSIRLPPNMIWKPDILMYNSADEDIDSKFPTNIVVSSSGSLLWVPPGLFKSTCKIDITWFPFDDQHCSMKFGSWTYDGSQIDLQLNGDSGDASTFIPNGEWHLIDLPAKRNVLSYDCCPEEYIDITFTVHIRRRTLYYLINLTVPCLLLGTLVLFAFTMPPGAGEKVSFGVPAIRHNISYDCCPETYIDITFTIHIRRRTLYFGFNLIIPCVLISSMALLAFTLPPDAGEKISLGVTILLSLTVFLLIVAETMPPTSDAVPLIGIYFACIMLMCSMSVVFTVLVLNYHHRSQETHEMPEWVRKGICEWLAWVLRMKRPGQNISRKKVANRNSSSRNMRDVEMRERSSRSLLANVLDLEDDFRGNSIQNFTGIKIDDNSHGCQPRQELREILKEIKFLTDKVKKDEESAESESDWKWAASVVDRLCLWMFTIFTIVSTFAILFSAPHVIS